ncbi:MAG: class I SAM-dependent methyltransferase [Solirubrobacterales bacterium]
MDPALPWSDWALLPPALELIEAEVDAGRREVVECGSGVSTIAIARRLAAVGDGRLCALEHDRGWAAEIRGRIEAEGLAGRARVIEASLGEHPLARPGCRWYSQAALADLPASGIELLLVDGPPAGDPGLERSRYPALPALADRLAGDALVVLDDIDRPGEQWVLGAWERETDFRFERSPDLRLAIGRRPRPASA